MERKKRIQIKIDEQTLKKANDLSHAEFHDNRSKAICFCINHFSDFDKLSIHNPSVHYNKDNMDAILKSGKWLDAQHFVNGAILAEANRTAQNYVKDKGLLDKVEIKRMGAGYTDNEGNWHEPSE